MFLLNKKLPFLKENFLSLDISDNSIKVLQLENKGGFNWIRSCGFSRLAEGAVVNGTILNKENVIWSIKNAIDKAGPKKINTKKVFCSLPESKVFSRIITVPDMSSEDAGEAIKWEIEANIPLSVDQVYYDWQFLKKEADEKKEKKNGQQILAVAISKEVVDDIMNVMKDAGMEVYILEPESIANARSLIKSDSSLESSCVIVDIGSRKTNLVIVEKNIPFFTSSISFSSESVTDLISKHFGISEKKAEEMKSQQTNTRYDEKNSILAITDSLLENLISGIEKSIDFYLNSTKNSPDKIDRIILTGGGSNLRGLAEFLSKRLEKEIEIGNPLSNLNLHKKSPIIEKSVAPSYSVAVGLALRSLYYGNKY